MDSTCSGVTAPAHEAIYSLPRSCREVAERWAVLGAGEGVGCRLGNAAMDNELLSQNQILCDDSAAATGSNQLSQGGEQVKQQANNISPAVRG